MRASTRYSPSVLATSNYSAQQNLHQSSIPESAYLRRAHSLFDSPSCSTICSLLSVACCIAGGRSWSALQLRAPSSSTLLGV